MKRSTADLVGSDLHIWLAGMLMISRQT